MRKEQLQEYRHICAELRRLNDQRVQWMFRAERSTRAPTMAPVMGGQHDPMPMIADKLAGIRAQADQLAGRLADAKLRVERAIEALPSVQRQIMRARYIDGKCWMDISFEMSISEPRLYELHKKALSNIKFKQANRKDCGKIIPKDVYKQSETGKTFVKAVKTKTENNKAATML